MTPRQCRTSKYSCTTDHSVKLLARVDEQCNCVLRYIVTARDTERCLYKDLIKTWMFVLYIMFLEYLSSQSARSSELCLFVIELPFNVLIKR